MKNPFEELNNTTPATASTDNTVSTEPVLEQAQKPAVDLQKNSENTPLAPPPIPPKFDKPKDSKKYEFTPTNKQGRLKERVVEKEMSDEEYHARLTELNTNAENKHYVLFFGQPASGKTWIIGSLLHYMKNYLGGTVYLDTNKTTESEEALFYQMQDRFNGVVYAEKLTSTDTRQYFELHIKFTPQDSSKPPMDIVFVDASGEHSEDAFNQIGKDRSGKLPGYLNVILESNVQTKIAFVYDQSLVDERGSIPQMNVLNAVFTHIQQIQNSQKKKFPKALLMSKADRIYANDLSTVERCGYDPMNYALEKIPSFANSFFNEDPNNKTIFYKMGTFSLNSDLILEFDKECPEKLFRWLYMEGNNGASPITEKSCWDKFKSWFKGEA